MSNKFDQSVIRLVIISLILTLNLLLLTHQDLYLKAMIPLITLNIIIEMNANSTNWIDMIFSLNNHMIDVLQWDKLASMYQTSEKEKIDKSEIGKFPKDICHRIAIFAKILKCKYEKRWRNDCINIIINNHQPFIARWS
jgi:hypothetical protein